MSDLFDKIAVLEQEAKETLSTINCLQQVTELKVKYLGRKGLIISILQEMRILPPDKKALVGKEINRLKSFLEEKLSLLAIELKSQQITKKIQATSVDVTLPGRCNPVGHLHPVTQVMTQMKHIFTGMGFSIYEGPEVESDFYNFEALNFPKDHPARDMQDTFYVDDGEKLLRTHTSPVQVHVMQKMSPPLRIIAPGAVYRRDADVTHSPMFHQVEGLLVDQNISLGDLKGVITAFLNQMFGDIGVRFRPSFFPFTEPSAEVDIACVFCKAAGCRICKDSGWLEIMGAGMVDPNVFKAVGYDAESVTGFAFGIGVERVAMLKYGISDIRLLFEGDLRFLNQF